MVDWIGINENIPFPIIFNGVDLFKEEVSEVITQIKKFGTLDKNDHQPGYSFRFLDLGICFWRESKTEDLLNDLERADEADNEWMQVDIG